MSLALSGSDAKDPLVVYRKLRRRGSISEKQGTRTKLSLTLPKSSITFIWQSCVHTSFRLQFRLTWAEEKTWWLVS